MLSVKESAQTLGISEARVRKLISDGALHAVKIGKSWAVSEEGVIDRLAAKPKSGRPRTAGEDTTRPAGAGFFDDASRTQELRQLYRACKEAFERRPPVSCIQSADTEEEAAFYIATADFFLQQKQAELVKNGVF